VTPPPNYSATILIDNFDPQRTNPTATLGLLSTFQKYSWVVVCWKDDHQMITENPSHSQVIIKVTSNQDFETLVIDIPGEENYQIESLSNQSE